MSNTKKPLITFKNYCFSYPQRHSNQKTINIEEFILWEGEIVVLTGKSGCGKSTLAKATAGILKELYPKNSSGLILLDGKQPLEDLSLAEIALTIGLVQQDPDSQLCTFTVEQEIAFGLENLRYNKNDINKKLNWALEVTQIQHLRYRDTSQLSGGEKQRVILAAMLALSPRLLILDEPTANLDPDSTNRIVSLLEPLKQKNMTILIIEHKLKKFLPYADRLVIMDQGTIQDEILPKKYLNSDFNGDNSTIRPLRLPENISIAHNPDYSKNILEIRNLSFSYGKHMVLNNFNLDIATNEIIGIIGPNGAGKTTLLQCINGILPTNTDYQLNLFQKDIKGDNTAKRAKNIGTVFQNPNFQLFERTVEKELLFTAKNLNILEENTIILANKLLEDLHLVSYKDKTPFALSYGEKKRLTIASTTLHNPSLILLDEPFIGQDYRNVLALLNQLKRFHWSLLMVSHDPELLGFICDRIVFIKKGSILVNDKPSIAFDKINKLGYTSYLPENWKNRKNSEEESIS
jgi:energy-coupling factor transporter ATP-binding protein EcfA2